MMTDIHPNMAPISLPWLTLWDWLILIILTLCLLALLRRWWLKRPQKTIPEVAKAPATLPSQDILRKLKKHIETENWKAFCTESSEAFKKTLSVHNQSDLIEKTTEELIAWTKQKNAKALKDVIEFFALVDPIKYAGADGQKIMAQKALDIFKAYYQK